MEAFTFLRYWRGAANVRPTVTEIVTAPLVTDGDSDGDGPFFDLEFGVEDETEPGQPEPGSSGADSDSEEEFNVPVSPSDDLFFQGEPIPVQTGTDPDPNIKSQFSRLKSATNFRVLMLKLKKNRESGGEKKEKQVKSESKSKFFTVKFKLEEIQIKSVFKRDNSSKSSKKTECTEEKKISRDVMQRYLKMIKILKRNDREAAAEVAVASLGGEVSARRRDDSLVQQQDGIQGAILHCKRSFNSSRDSEFSILSQSERDLSLDHKSMNVSIKNCSDEPVESSL